MTPDYQYHYNPAKEPFVFEPIEVAKGFFCVFFIFGPLTLMLAICRGWL